MALPTSGELSLKQIAKEIMQSASPPYTLGSSLFRKAINKPTGPISIKDFYGFSGNASIKVNNTKSITNTKRDNFVTQYSFLPSNCSALFTLKTSTSSNAAEKEWYGKYQENDNKVSYSSTNLASNNFDVTDSVSSIKTNGKRVLGVDKNRDELGNKMYSVNELNYNTGEMGANRVIYTAKSGENISEFDFIGNSNYIVLNKSSKSGTPGSNLKNLIIINSNDGSTLCEISLTIDSLKSISTYYDGSDFNIKYLYIVSCSTNTTTKDVNIQIHKINLSSKYIAKELDYTIFHQISQHRGNFGYYFQHDKEAFRNSFDEIYGNIRINRGDIDSFIRLYGKTYYDNYFTFEVDTKNIKNPIITYDKPTFPFYYINNAYVTYNYKLFERRTDRAIYINGKDNDFSEINKGIISGVSGSMNRFVSLYPDIFYQENFKTDVFRIISNSFSFQSS